MLQSLSVSVTESGGFFFFFLLIDLNIDDGCVYFFFRVFVLTPYDYNYGSLVELIFM